MNVLDLRAAPAVDRLVVVAHRHDIAGVPGQQPQPRVLNRVGVLELIDQELPEAAPVMREQGIVVPHEFMTPQQQFGEVHQAATGTGGFIGLV